MRDETIAVCEAVIGDLQSAAGEMDGDAAASDGKDRLVPNAKVHVDFGGDHARS